jgi:thymidine phosphorylase
MTSAQGGDLKALDPIGSPKTSVTAVRGGFVTGIDGTLLGATVAQRESSPGARPPGQVGIRLRKRVGDAVRAQEAIADIYGDPALASLVTSSIAIGDRAPAARPAVISQADGGM